MNKSKKIIIGILIVLIIVVGIVVAYKIIENSVINRADFNFTVENISSSPVNTIDHGQNDTELNRNANNEDTIGDVFNAKIKEIREHNGMTTILIEGLETNDINHRGEFDFSIDNDTELLWNNTKIEVSDLKEGQDVSITSTGEVLESYPAQLTKVTKIIVLEDEL